VSCRHSAKRPGHLSNHVGGHLPPCDSALHRISHRDRGIEVHAETGPNARISATSAAPVATAFARSAIATLPPARRSPIMPEPTTDISRKAVPNASVAARGTTTSLLCVSEFDSTSEGAHDLRGCIRRHDSEEVSECISILLETWLEKQEPPQSAPNCCGDMLQSLLQLQSFILNAHDSYAPRLRPARNQARDF
jgi:hypothetical protein